MGFASSLSNMNVCTYNLREVILENSQARGIMQKLNWAIDENEYHLKTPYGVAIISEVREDIGDKTAVGARYSYKARFEHTDGTTSHPKHDFFSFDEAEGWLLWGIVMEIDQPEGVELGTKKLFTTLKVCEKLLPSTNIDTHHKRIRQIKHILRGDRRQLSQNTRFMKKYYTNLHKYLADFHPLNWQEQGDEYFTQLDQGRGVIKEIRNQNTWIIGRVSSYYPRIEYSQGEVFKGIEAVSFEEAEQWIKSKLFEINHALPRDDENGLEDLQTTLALCIQVLPEDTDPIHFLRLEWIENRISEILL